MAAIKITSGNQVISIESDDAGVPDVTQGTGPDMLELQDDAMANPNETNAEFDASIDDSQVESEDHTEAVEKANESFFDAIFGMEDGDEASITGEGDGETSDAEPVVTGDDDAAGSEEPAAEEGGETGEGAGEVSESDGVTTIDTGDTVITISNNDNGAPAEEPATEETPAEGAEDGEPNMPAEGAEGADAAASEQAIESFFENLGL